MNENFEKSHMSMDVKSNFSEENIKKNAEEVSNSKATKIRINLNSKQFKKTRTTWSK